MLLALVRLVQDAIHFRLAKRHRFVVLAKETRDLRDVLYEVINLIRQLRAQQDIARQEFVFRFHLDLYNSFLLEVEAKYNHYIVLYL